MLPADFSKPHSLTHTHTNIFKQHKGADYGAGSVGVSHINKSGWKCQCVVNEINCLCDGQHRFVRVCDMWMMVFMMRGTC